MGLDELEKYQIEILIRRLKTLYPKQVSGIDLEELKNNMINSKQDFITLSRELNSIFSNEAKIEALFLKYQVSRQTEEATKEVKQEVQHALNMSEITDFNRNGNTYIKITYQDGRVQMIENRNGKDTKKIFEDVQRLRTLNNMDGITNAEAAFKELLKDYVEVPFENTMFMNQEQLKAEEQSKLNFVQMNFPNNRVLASVEENMFIIKGNPDVTVEVVDINGRYSLRQIGEATYGVNEKTKENSVLKTETIVERPNNIKQEYSVKELEKITEGMTEEEIVEYLRIHGKNPSQIMMILLSLEEAKAAKEKEQEKSSLEKPKQMVLTNNNIRGKMAAFVDTLYLAFLVGMISGATFFAMLRFILHSL